MIRLNGYNEDFQIAMQNLLLGGLFNRKLSRRDPLGSKEPVVTPDQHAQLMNYFRSNTAWGQARAGGVRG